MGGIEERSCCYLPGASELVWELGMYSAPGLGLEGEVGRVGERAGPRLWARIGMGGEERKWTRAFQTWIHLSLDWLENSLIMGTKPQTVEIGL